MVNTDGRGRTGSVCWGGGGGGGGGGGAGIECQWQQLENQSNSWSSVNIECYFV